MKRKYIAYIALPVLGLLLLGVVRAENVSAYGRMSENFGGLLGWFGIPSSLATSEQVADWQREVFEEKAAILGISVDEVKNAWAQGKSPLAVIEEKDLNKEEVRARAKEAAKQRLDEHLQTLVSRGVITQTQADQRLQSLEKLIENSKGFHGMFRGIDMRMGTLLSR